MNDRELLELAAKAAGVRKSEYTEGVYIDDSNDNGLNWNPLTDDGDALRLAVKLHIGLDLYNGHVESNWCDFVRSEERFIQEFCDEAFEGIAAKQAATRRAIVRAAAEIGKTL